MLYALEEMVCVAYDGYSRNEWRAVAWFKNKDRAKQYRSFLISTGETIEETSRVVECEENRF